MAQLGLGLAALGRPGYLNLGHAGDLPSVAMEAMSRHAGDVLEAAYQGGIRHLDAARSYGRGEQFIRDWLDRRPHPDVVVSSKWGYRYVARWEASAPVHEVKDHSLTQLLAQYAESRTVLKDELQVYEIHSVTPGSPVLSDAGVLDQLVRLRDGGLQLGVSVTGPQQAEAVRQAVEVERGGRRLFDWVQATWNLLEPSVGPALAEAHARGVKVIVKEPLANGRLSSRTDVAAFLSLAASRGVSPDALALASALAQPWAHLVLLGSTTLAQLESNLKARETPPVEAGPLAQVPAAYWAYRSTLAWT
jgi:aryl-alcohol dehydrogenase-like predicted oxidoreductase